MRTFVAMVGSVVVVVLAVVVWDHRDSKLLRRLRRKQTPPPPVLVPSDGSHDALDEDPERDAMFDELATRLGGSSRVGWLAWLGGRVRRG